MSWIKKCNVYLGYMVDIPVTVVVALSPAAPPPHSLIKTAYRDKQAPVTFLPLYIHSYNNLVQQQHCCFSRPKQCNIDFSMRFLKDLNTCDNLPKPMGQLVQTLWLVVTVFS